MFADGVFYRGSLQNALKTILGLSGELADRWFNGTAHCYQILEELTMLVINLQQNVDTQCFLTLRATCAKVVLI